MKKYLANKHWKKATIISSTLIVFAIALFWVSPFVFTLINSFKPLRESIDSSNFFKLSINSTQNNYSKSFSDINYFHAFFTNSWNYDSFKFIDSYLWISSCMTIS